LVWNPSWFQLTTGIIWAQVRKFERFGACFCTCALIIWSVLLHSALSVHRRSTSTHPRPTDGQNKNARLAWHRTRSLFTVSSSTSPWCPGMAGHSRGTSLQQPPQRSTKLHLKGTRRPCLLLPYKRAGRGLYKGGRTMDDEKPVTISP
jgi:hypothetical protein